VSEYRIELRPAAVRALRKLDLPVARRLQGAISLLADLVHEFVRWFELPARQLVAVGDP
jgi:hypothetical protein